MRGPLREEPLEKEAKSCRDTFYFMFNKLLNAYEDYAIKCEKSEATACKVYEHLMTECVFTLECGCCRRSSE